MIEQSPNYSPDQSDRELARQHVATNSLDLDDEFQLLDMLGLLEDEN